MKIEISEAEVKTIREYQETVKALYSLLPDGATENSQNLQAALSKITGFNPYD